MPVIQHVQNIINSFETLRHDMDTVSNKIKVDTTRDELLELFFSLADRLEYDTRSKW